MLFVFKALHHPWLKSQTDATSSEPVILGRIREFAQFNKFKKEALKVKAPFCSLKCSLP